MDFTIKIRLAETYAKVSEAELARRMGTTSQNLGQKIKRGRFNAKDMEELAAAMGAKFEYHFCFPDGTKI